MRTAKSITSEPFGATTLWCNTIRVLLAIVAFAIVGIAIGCQKYESRPLDPRAHQAAWYARTPSDDSVRAFADKLAEVGHLQSREFNPSDGLSVAEGEIVALVFNPELRIARLRAGVAAATAEHAGLWDDPQFSIDVLRITESVSNPWVITPGIGFTIPISGRLGVEKDRADASMHAELQRVVEAEWRVRHDVRRAWLEWSAATLRLEEQNQLFEAVERLARSTQMLAEAGEMIKTEAALFAMERTQRSFERRRLQGEIASLEQRIRSLIGISPEAPIAFVPALDRQSRELEIELQSITERNPALLRLSQEYQVAEQTLRREIHRQYPDLTIGPLYETDQGQSRIGFLGAIPLPILNANKQGIAEAEAERELARAAYETEYERIVGLIAALLARAKSLEAEHQQIVAEMVPLVDQQLKDAQQLLALGEGGGLILLESLVRAHDTKMHLIDVRLEEAALWTEITQLLGPSEVPAALKPIDSELEAGSKEVTE